MKKLLWVNGDTLNEQEKIKLRSAFRKYENYPVLKQAWLIKEKIIFMYRAQSEEEAKKRFDYVMMLLKTPVYSHYLVVLRGTIHDKKMETADTELF